MLAAVIMANVLVARHPVRWDFTQTRAFSLSEATREVLAHLEQPVQAIGFYEYGQSGPMGDLLQEYAAASRGLMQVTVVDPVTQPALAQHYQVVQSGTVILEQGTRREKVDPWDLASEPEPADQPGFAGEQALTRALVRLTQERQRLVYFLQGHGERDPQGDFAQARRALEAEGYLVRSLNLATEPQIPDTADAVIVAGPHRDLAEREVRLVSDWAHTGKGLIFLVDPLPAGGTSLANLGQLMRQWGVALDDNLVVDPGRNYLFDAATPVPEYARHAITGKLEDDNLVMVMPGTRSLHLTDTAAAASPLLVTSGQAWAAPATAVQPGKAIRPQPASSRGPFTLAMAVEFPDSQPASATAGGAGAAADSGPGEPRPGKAVFVGSSAFAVNDTVRIQGNLDFLLNAVNWATSREDGLSIRPRPALRRDLTLTGRDITLIFWVSVALLPLLVLAAGGMVWWRCRAG